LAAPPITPVLEPVKEPPAQVPNTETTGES